jgi:holo-[acyl-carrier protein] synthase
MIVSTGIDAVEVARFTEWHTKPIRSLKRIFSDSEITYCVSNKKLSAQRFAVRFAAREAVYKVIHTIPALQKIPFLTMAHAIVITKRDTGAPKLHIDWQKLGIDRPPQIIWHLSMTHTKELAIASVIAEQQL